METVNAVGRRKAAVARVIVREGNGQIVINHRPLDVYFPSSILQYIEALRLAIARALVKINPDDKSVLRKEGFMTRDPRAVERKKPGQPKARKRFQFSKR